MEKSDNLFKILFIIGLGVIIISLFLDWYIYSYSIDSYFISWSFNLFDGWRCLTEQTSVIPALLDMNLMYLMIYLFLFVILTAVFVYFCFNSTLFEKKSYFEKIKSLSYIFLLFLLYNAFILISFFNSLIEAYLYFPFLELVVIPENSKTIYSLGTGFYFNIISFVLIFPYSVFVFTIPYKFKREAPEISIDETVKENSEQIDLDKIIQEVRIKSDKAFNYNIQEIKEVEEQRDSIDKIKLESGS